MASGELLKKLFKNYKQRDDEAFLVTAMQVIDEERRKKHNVLARDLQRILENGNGHTLNSTGIRQFEKLPRDRERNALLFDIRSPERYLDDIVLEESIQQQIDVILEEFRAGAILQTYRLQPRHKLLFCGPPGCGKTLCAEVLSGELGIPLIYTRFDAVISSYLGETASNLRKVFDYASRGSWVVFFDEFDAIGKSRDDASEHGELKRVINTFLQLLDGFQSDSLVIASTNHEGLLDNALWRRFDDILYFDKPTQEQILPLIHLKLKGFRHKNTDFTDFVPQMTGWSHADIERVCLEAMKIGVLSDNDQITPSTFEEALQRQMHRTSTIRKTKTPNH